MKFEKRVDQKKGIDTYILSITHTEADAAFAAMTPDERVMVKELQQSEQISLLLKIVLFWVQRIEETHSASGSLPRAKGNL